MRLARSNILVFDLGTTNLKAALFDESGHMVALARRAAPVTCTSDRVEMPIESFHATLSSLVSDLATTADLSHVSGISFSSQANSFALFNDANHAITPIIMWSDNRAIGIDEPLNELADLSASSGVPSVTHQFAEAKLRWIVANEPNVANRASKILFISDLFVEWMTGRHETELSLACMTALACRTTASWSEQRIALLNVPPMTWPTVKRAGQKVGSLLPDRSTQLGLPRSATLYMGCLDQYAGAIGTGVTTPGDVCETTGTVLAAVQCVATDAPPPGDRVFEGPSFSDDRIFRMSFSSTSANLLDWYRAHHRPEHSFETLIDLANRSTCAADVGRVTSDIREAFVHVDLSGPPGPIVKGIMRRVCEELHSLLHTLNADCHPIRSAGGAARSEAWLQMKADRLGVPVSAAATDEPTCLGAAILTAYGSGLASVDELTSHWCRPRKALLPTTAPRHVCP